MPNPDVRKIGKYEIQAELGQGGFGRVYRAFDPTVGRPVALKILTAEGNRDLLTRFRNEATSAGNLRHRNIVTIHDYGEFSGRPYLVMELLEGEDLTQTIASGRQLTLLDKMSIMDQVADGLECAHSNGVVHRDVKPANIRLLPDGTVKILDFGIARISRDQKATRLTQQGDLIGTILYMSPEQFGGADADTLCDIFAYGVIYFEFLTGTHPFRSNDPRSVMFKITMEDAPSLRSFLPVCPEALEQILHRAMHKDRELRYQSLRDLRLDTEPLIFELKQARARTLVVEAQELSARDTPQDAIALINEALILDPGNRDARQLREIIQRRIQKELLQPRIDAMLQTAQEQIAKRSLSQALQTLESALKLDPSNARIRDLLDGTGEELKRVNEAARLAADALAHMTRGEWPAAFENGSQAVRLDSSNKEASRVLDAIQKHEHDLSSRIESQIGSGDLDSAIASLRDLAALHPDSAAIQNRLAETTANKAERDRVQAVTERARQMIAETRFAEAIALLAESALPDDPGVVELRETALKSQAARDRDLLVQNIVADCNRLGAENRFEQALEAVEAGLLRLPGESALAAVRERLQAQRAHQAEERRAQEELQRKQRREAVRDVLARAAQLEGKRDFAAALNEIDAGLAHYPDEKSLTEKRNALQAAKSEFARQRAREAALRQAQDLAGRAQASINNEDIDTLLDETKSLAQSHSTDEELYRIAVGTGQQLLDLRQARSKAATGDLEGARALSEKHLKQSPQHAGFLDVQRQIAERERLIATEYRQEVDRILREQSDVARRAQALDEAVRRYPSEPHYRDELNSLNTARATANDAGELEKAGRFSEALGLWNRIGSTYPAFPGLQAHLDRTTALHEQSRRDARAGWAEQIQKALSGGDHTHALELASKAEADFPGEFSQLAIQAKQSADQRAQAQRVLAEAKDLMGKARWADGQAKLRDAMGIAPGDALIAQQGIEAHAKYSRAAVKAGDWRAAEALLHQASSLDPGFKAPADLRSKIEEQKRNEAVEQAVGESERLQQSGELQAALGVILQAEKTYPEELKLRDRKAGIEKTRLLEELRSLDAERRKTTGVNELERILDRARVIAKPYANDPAFASAVDSIAKQVEQLRYRDDVARKVGEERNLARREEMLLEAFRRYPAEPYFKQELDSVREKQRIVAGILKEAREAEKAGNYEAALGHWERVRAIDAGYPELDAEMQRLAALLAGARSAALQAALEGVRIEIDGGRLQQAESLLGRIESEFGASASGECARIRERLDGLTAAARLAEEGRTSFAKRDWAGGSAKFLQAARRVPNESRVVETIFGELIRQAESVVESDWRAAHSITQAAGDLKPDSQALLALRARVDEGRREEFIAGALQESQKLRDAGDLRAAEREIQTALASCPAETRLTASLTGIRSAIEEEARRQRRDQAVDELAAIAREIATANLRRLRKTDKQIEAVSARAASDPEVQARVAEVRGALALRISELEAPRPPVTSIAEPGDADLPPGRSKRKFVVIGAAAAAAVIIGLIVVSRGTKSGHQIPVSVASEVAGASVTVGNQSCVTPACALKLTPGTYTLLATKDGFKPITQPVRVLPEQTDVRLLITFEPLPQVVQVNTNFESGQVFLDGQPAGDLRDGQFSISGIAPGQHTLRLTGGGAEFQTAWLGAIGSRPELTGQIEAKDVQATVIANAGSTAAVACNCGVQTVTVDGAAAGQTPGPGGAPFVLQNLTEGSKQLSVAGRTLILDVRPNPTLNVFLSLDRNVGTIVVDAGEDNARVFLNNRVYRRTTQHGTVRIPVDVGRYLVRVEKEGFQGVPAQTVEVQKGDEKRLVMALKPVPPVMEIAGGLPGAQVKIDGRVVGEIGPNGALRAEAPPGDHVIELTKEDYPVVRFSATFVPGKTLRPDRAQLAMVRTVIQPPPPDPKQIDAQDWERARTSNSVESLEDYVRKHPGGAHLDDARTLAARLRQDAQASAARQAEQTVWDATDKTRKAALQDFLARFGNGAHAQDARGLLSGIDRQEADALAAAQRAKELKDKEQEQANRTAADQQSIARFLTAYETAYSQMDLKAIEGMWNPMPKNVVDITNRQFRDAKSVTLQMRPAGQATVNGDSAVIVCTRILSLVSKDGQRPRAVTERVRVSLSRAGSAWTLNSITPF